MKKDTIFENVGNESFKVTTIEPKMQRDFKGIWVPKEIWLDDDLSILEKCLLVEIDSLDMGENHCWASNAYFADFFKISETSISNHIKKLKELGYIKQVGFNGRFRLLKSSIKEKLKGDLKKTSKQTSENCKHNNTINNKVNNKEKSPEVATAPSTATKKNSKKQSLFNQLKKCYNDFLLNNDLSQATINKVIWDAPKERTHCNSLLKKFDAVYELTGFLEEAENDKWISERGFMPSFLMSQFARLYTEMKKNMVCWEGLSPEDERRMGVKNGDPVLKKHEEESND